MKAIKRRRDIIEYLEANQTAYISELSEHLNVSAMTIRRDLNAFAEQGLVTLIHGGAVLNRGVSFTYSRRFRKQKLHAEKRRIAQYCANLVNEGSSVFIDCGSTPEEIAEMLVNKKNIVVLTNSLPVANILSAAKNLKLIMAPGVFYDKPQGFLGQFTTEFISRFKIDILFLGGDGIDSQRGATNPDIIDSSTKRSLVKQAVRTIFAADHTKLGTSSFISIADLKELSLVVTDTGADAQIVTELRSHGLEIVLV